jgi:outer membrane protein assembly factor BamA
MTVALSAGVQSPAQTSADQPAEIKAIGPITIQAPPSGARQGPVFSEGEIGDLLKPFLGTTCAPATIADALARRYRFLGYVPGVDVTCDTGRLDVSIRESSHQIVLITFDAAELSLVGVSPDTDIEERRRLYSVPGGSIRAVLRGLLQTHEGDLYNHERYRSDSAALGRLGYAVAFVPGATAGPEGYPRGAYLVQSLIRRRSNEYEGPPRRTSYLGGTAAYGPRTGTAGGLLFQETDLFTRLDSLTVAPSYGAELGGTIAYTTPLLTARESPRRLYDIGGSVFSSFQNDRLLDGNETDERRSGGAINLGMRPLGLGAPHDVRWQIGLRHERVTVGGGAAPSNSENLTLVQLGATYEWRHVYRSPSLSLRLAPAVDFSVDAVGGRRSFVRPAIDATLHGRFPSRLEADLHFLAGTVDREVPAAELWSLGGPGTVRGFREDAFLGRHVLAQQSELWVPLFRTLASRPVAPGEPLPGPGDLPLERPTARLLKVAFFVDAGHLTGTVDGRAETILGAGVGLRFVIPRQPLVLRLDYGWGLGGRGGDSFPYFSAGYRF